jgi:alcohol dehydrogenase class IV
MKSWSFSVPQVVYQGSGCISVLPGILKKEGWKRVLVVAGPTFISLGGLKPFEELLEQAGCQWRVFSKIEPNPLCSDVENHGVPMYREFKADVMLAIGGGSTLDSAKGIAIIGDSDKTIFDIAGVMGKYPLHDPLPWNTYPMIAVPTTCGTGSEVLRNAVLSEPNGHKLVPMHDSILPAYAVCDPDLLATLPRPVAAASGMDALVQAIEGLVSLAANDFGRTAAFRAIELMGPKIVDYVNNPADPDCANAMSLGCIYAGLAWGNSYPAHIHGSNHPFTEILHISHGDACALLLPWFVEYNGETCFNDFHRVRDLMYPAKAGTEFAIAGFVRDLIQLNHDLGIMGGKTLIDYGCSEEVCTQLIATFYSDNPCFPRPISKEEMRQVFIRLMNGEYA